MISSGGEIALPALGAALTVFAQEHADVFQVSMLKALSWVDFALCDSGACVFAVPHGFFQPPA